ncbi:MAG: hypothetical protein JST50_04760 [Bacteroidetes bacterium]|jgi:hypothetical protein|nr:hypothetical protein [Bacteroidota bacterium]
MPNSSTFSPNSFFFTDPAAISQVEDQAFGPVSADEYRLTSKFTIAANANAYAICTGVVLVQPTADSDKVNLILRPFKQPITGLNIKYFIYRGLSIGDFFDSTNTNVIAADSNTSDFINKINASFAAYYTSTQQTAPDFLAKYIGFDEANQPDSMLISDLFFKIANYTSGTEDTHAFELPLITAGASLGQFVAGECGIDVVLDYGDYQLPTPNDQFVFDLSYARSAEASIDLTSETDDFKKKLLKEQIFQFLDVAAYYGFHYGNGVVQTSDGSGSTTNNKADAIYTLIQNFFTKNCLYLYIQSDRTRSYNFYGNYQISDTDTNNLKIGDTEDALNEVVYSSNGWPLMIINAPDGITDATSSLFLQFVTDNNDNTILYGQVAQIENATGNNFFSPDDLRQAPNTDGTTSNFTEIVQIANPVTGTDGSKTYVATFNILIYQGQTYDYVTGETTTDSNGNTINVTAQPAFFDDVFGELNATPIFKTTDSSSYSVVSSQRLKLINHFYNNVQYGASAVQTLIVNDVLDTGDSSNPSLNRVIYVSEAADTLNNTISVTGTVSADTQTFPTQSGTASGNETYQLPSSCYYNITVFTDDTDQINGLSINSTDNSISSKILLGLTKDENDLVKALNGDNSLTNVRLYLVALFDSGNELVSVENTIYQKFKAGVVGEDANGQLQLKLPDTDVNVYSLDQKYYFTKAYSDYMKTDTSVTALVLNLEISL